ncbi:MAG: LPS export ABC transporter periplasmic protein LptC [Sphingomonadales bacterium]
MSEAAALNRDKRLAWARPGSAHDRNVRVARVALPSAVGALAAVLAIAPLTKRAEVSFVLDKDKVEIAKERMRVTSAQYRGQDDKGQGFLLNAGSAVQATSKIPVVQLGNLSAFLATDTGTATIVAPRADYDLNAETLKVVGPLTFATQDGYKLSTSNVVGDLNTRKLSSAEPVSGEMPLGTFSAGNMSADLASRTVTLGGRARLHIVQGGVRAKK